MAWAHADIYRHVDANGVIHFTNAPSKPGFQLYMKEIVSKASPSTPGDALAPASLTGVRTDGLNAVIQDTARRHGLNESLVMAVIQAESRFDHRAVSRKGAQGLMQLMPDTARELGVRNSFDPVENIEGGVRHLRNLLDSFGGKLHLALAAYNAGRDAVLQHRGIPPYPETQNYVRQVIQYYEQYEKSAQGQKKTALAGKKGS
jgi:soluble lytic murein transglycosylase